MWKILTAQIKEGIYYSLVSRRQERMLPENKRIRWYTFFQESKAGLKNVAMEWIDYK